MFNRLMVFLLCIAIVACAGPQVKFVGAQQITEGIHIGDRVALRTKQGKRYDFTVSKMGQDVIYGNDGHTNYKIAISEIAFVETREISTGRTLGVTAIAAIAILATLCVVGIFALGRALGSAQ
jgi:hypothetical protein